MIRRMIKIDEDKCIGCGLCATACHEGAIGMVDGKAKLLREDFCDGLGDCLPSCPTGAITFEEREAPAYNEAAVKAAQAAKKAAPQACGCPGSQSRSLERKPVVCAAQANVPSELRQWPVQIKLHGNVYFQEGLLLRLSLLQQQLLHFRLLLLNLLQI